MARTMFDLGFRNSFSPEIGINLKDITSKLTSFMPGKTPAAAPVPPTPAPTQTSSSIPPHVLALGGIGVLGTLAAIIFGHK